MRRGYRYNSQINFYYHTYQANFGFVDWVGNAAKVARDNAGKAGQWVGKQANTLGEQVGNGLAALGKGTVNNVNALGQTASQAGRKAVVSGTVNGNVLQRAGGQALEGVGNAAATTGQVLNKNRKLTGAAVLGASALGLGSGAALGYNALNKKDPNEQ